MRCVLGCPTGAKWTADRLLENSGRVEVRTGCEVVRLEFGESAARDGSAEIRGVRVRHAGREETVYADAVVLAAGGLGTPVILAKSGVPSAPRLFVEPVLCVAGPLPASSLDRQLPMPFVSQRDGYLLAPYFDWLSFYFNGMWRMPSSDIASIMVKLADESFGFYDGSNLSKVLTARDEQALQRAVEDCKCVLERLGVPRESMFLGTLNAGHPGGCVPLDRESASTLHPSQLPANVYVADASLLPSSLGAPPILTIMALSKRVARRALETLG